MDVILPCTSAQLNLDIVLNNGQSFRWKKSAGDYWIGVSHHRVWRLKRINDNQITFAVLHNFNKEKEQTSDLDVLKNYFQFDIDLENLYALWSTRDEHFRKLLAERRNDLEGIRILKQDPLEALISFICSANNNISRISKMVEKFCELYGDCVEIDVSSDSDCKQIVYDFPSITQLADNLTHMEESLRDSGFGYRAASISKTVHVLSQEAWVLSHGSADRWLGSLQQCSWEEAKENLLRLPGVGPKVADCVCLMGLGKHEVVPVDRHVFNLTCEIYKPKFLAKNKSMTRGTYKQIGDYYTDLFGEYAGWVQSVLFSTRLKRLK